MNLSFRSSLFLDSLLHAFLKCAQVSRKGNPFPQPQRLASHYPQEKTPAENKNGRHLYNLSSKEHPSLWADTLPRACGEVRLGTRRCSGLWWNTLTPEVEVAGDSVRTWGDTVVPLEAGVGREIGRPPPRTPQPQMLRGTLSAQATGAVRVSSEAVPVLGCRQDRGSGQFPHMSSPVT